LQWTDTKDIDLAEEAALAEGRTSTSKHLSVLSPTVELESGISPSALGHLTDDLKKQLDGDMSSAANRNSRRNSAMAIKQIMHQNTHLSHQIVNKNRTMNDDRMATEHHNATEQHNVAENRNHLNHAIVLADGRRPNDDSFYYTTENSAMTNTQTSSMLSLTSTSQHNNMLSGSPMKTTSTSLSPLKTKRNMKTRAARFSSTANFSTHRFQSDKDFLENYPQKKGKMNSTFTVLSPIGGHANAKKDVKQQDEMNMSLRSISSSPNKRKKNGISMKMSKYEYYLGSSSHRPPVNPLNVKLDRWIGSPRLLQLHGDKDKNQKHSSAMNENEEEEPLAVEDGVVDEEDRGVNGDDEKDSNLHKDKKALKNKDKKGDSNNNFAFLNL
jgi:hypothetical protein